MKKRLGNFDTINVQLSLILVMLMFSSGGAYAQQEADALEEIIVTGTLIRRTEGFIAASPVTTLSAEDLSVQGTVNMGEIVKNTTFNLGTGIANTTQGTSDNNASFNLRGLGSSATLTLMDGKRVPTENVQVMIPTIAIQRLEILKDGAAAMYGSDAVTGVVNYLPYKSYNGFEVEYFEEGDSRGDYSDRQLQFLTGTDISDNMSIIFAGSQRKQDAMYRIERPTINLAGLNQSPSANPGSFLVPNRDANGVLTGTTTRLADPSCSPTRDDPSKMGANPYGFLFAGRCWGDNGDTRNYRDDFGISTFYTNLNWEVSPDFNFQAQVNYSRLLETPRGSPSNPGSRNELLGAIRGELPGNPYRAVSGDNRELFAQPALDANGNTVLDYFDRALPLRGSDGAVVLAANPFASSASDPLGGVPFNEDVIVSSWRPFLDGGNTLPVQNNSDRSTPGDNDLRYWHTALTADYTIPFAPSWEGTSFYVFNQSRNLSRDTQRFSIKALQQALNCDVVNDREGCFNPFGVTDPRFVTPQAVADSIVTSYRVDHETILETFDTVFNGPIAFDGFQLPGGDIKAAIGYQRREETVKSRPSAGVISGDAFIGDQEDPRSESRSSDSYFAELLLPVLSNLELNAAVRDESFSTGQSSTVSKFGAVYAPTDWLALRATWGEAFIVPTLTQLFSPQVCFLGNVSDDPFSSFAGFTAACRDGNPNLLSENSETTSFSVDLSPLDDLDLTISWSETDFSNRIIRSNLNDILALDFFNFQQATGYVPATIDSNPPENLVEQWMNDPRHDPRVIRQAGDVTRIQRVIQSDTNASSMRVRAVDLELNYSMPFRDFGNFGFRLDATYMDEYRYQLSLERPVMNATGDQNGRTAAVPAVPRWKSNARFSWMRGAHSANLTVRYTHAVNFDNNESSFQRFWAYSNFRFTTEIHTWTQADLTYTYRDLELPMGGGSLTLTAGMRNMFDREAQKVGTSEGFVPELQDLLGRVLYMRLNYQF